MADADGHGISLAEATRVWARVAVLSFGGPAGQIALMHRILVDEKRWIGETRFLHALNYCMLLPGPEAHQLVIYFGWLLHGKRGGLLAGTLFVLPGLLSLGVLSWVYAKFGDIGAVQGLFLGLKAAVLALVLEALLKIRRRAIRSRALLLIALLAFIGIFFFGVPFPLIIIGAALLGLARHALGSPPELPTTPAGARLAELETEPTIDAAFARRLPRHLEPSARRLVRVTLMGLFIWLSPMLSLLALFGPRNVFTAIATFNSRMAVLTFGGAYAVLSYMAQQAVEHYHWLKPQEMLVGLGFAETTPGPLISVVQFVGFMAAYRHPGGLSPSLAGTLGGLLAQWCTCVPSFLWIFMGAPYMESVRNNRAISAALSAITAAVVGVVANLALWLCLHSLFGVVLERHIGVLVLHTPALLTLNTAALVLAVAAMVAVFRFRLGLVATLAGSSLAGMLAYVVGWAH